MNVMMFTSGKASTKFLYFATFSNNGEMFTFCTVGQRSSHETK